MAEAIHREPESSLTQPETAMVGPLTTEGFNNGAQPHYASEDPMKIPIVNYIFDLFEGRTIT
jgi:hypothetical protein